MACEPVDNCGPFALCNAAEALFRVTPLVAQGATVLDWDLDNLVDLFSLVAPVEVQIEIARANVSDNAAWSVVEVWEEGISQYVDTAQRWFGSDDNIAYRLAIRDSMATVVRTTPVRATDRLTGMNRALYRDYLRRWYMGIRGGSMRPGFLLKRIRHGTRCTVCRDRDSGAIIQSFCLTCYGTGYVGGFYQAETCCYAKQGRAAVSEDVDPSTGFRQEGPVTKFRMLNIPAIYPGDVWVERDTDLRWELGTVEYVTKIGTVSLDIDVEASRLDGADVRYRFEVIR